MLCGAEEGQREEEKGGHGTESMKWEGLSAWGLKPPRMLERSVWQSDREPDALP